MHDPLATIAYTTWSEIADLIEQEAETYELGDHSAARALRRVAVSAVEAVAAHG